jgi:hypothetical protein
MADNNKNTKRTAADFLPKYFKTDANKKFLSATIDQMITEGTVEKVNAYIGRKNTPAYKSTDPYLPDVSIDRQAYQLEPAVVSIDTLDNVTFFKDYNDYINQLSSFSGLTVNQSKANSQEFYSWNPHIDWDKFVNYREYYWLPSGPQAVTISGQSTNIISEYTISLLTAEDNISYIFSPDGKTSNPKFKLYRGQTYNFVVDCKDRPIAFKTIRSPGDANIYTKGIRLFDESGVELFDADGNNIVSKFTGKGTIQFTVPADAPNVLYYVSETDVNTSGFITIYDIVESTEINVEEEILGKRNYRTSSDVVLSNGMKITFQGQVSPAKYNVGNWYVEGVGRAIYLIAEQDLETPAPYTNDQEIEFDSEYFDSQGFDVNTNYPKDKDYIVINRGSKDRNPWSRYNRWFHRSVIEAAAIANNQPAVIDQNSRAKRPIIEFEPNIQLWNFGKITKNNVTLVDTFTTDVFSTIEGSYGYNVDGVQLVDGMRILFTADTDSLVVGRIFKVASVTHLGVQRITLLPETDTEPQEGEIVLVSSGAKNSGKMFYYSNGKWVVGQEKTTINQCPLFQVVDSTGVSYASSSKYPGSTFAGTTLFSYESGTSYDSELGFNISYMNVGNFGDIVFNFNLHTDSFTYQSANDLIATTSLDVGYLVINSDLTTYSHDNGWVKSAKTSFQEVVQQIDIDRIRNYFAIDVYANSGLLTDLTVKVYVNGIRQYETDFDVVSIDNQAYVRFFSDLPKDSTLIIKSRSSAEKINGYYEFPANLESNPQNLSIGKFTLGEINNHVSSIADNITNFKGTVPGANSLRDLGNITPFGTRVVQHSAPLMPVVYHITNKDYNVINALRFARLEYAKFKRNFLRIATEYGYDGLTRLHLDAVLKEATKDYTITRPFYLSDMIPYGANFIFEQEVIDNSITEYPLTFDFDLTKSSKGAVLVYLNESLLVANRDYIFIDSNFVRILTDITSGDNLKIVQYEKTDGSFLPPTPTKLGLYPAFEPKLFLDNTYATPTMVIQGHDGSITVAFNDYRDQLLLEFETRIFNNIKSAYNTSLFDLSEFIPAYDRQTEISTEELNAVMAGDFLHWSSLIAEDYTKHTFFERTNPKTYNYKKFSAPNGKMLAGFWRGIFKDLYDTDRPHTHPWEMLGFSIEPTWWQGVYGPAPYTSNNLLLWEDLSAGLIKEPGKLIVKKSQFVRSYLLDFIPVDESGNLRTPLELGIVTDYVSTAISGEFKFGDHAPIETAWRRSSEFPFALITALTLLKPAQVFATCFDRERQYRDDTGQIVYKVANGNLRFNIKNLVLSPTPDDSARTYTAGLVNFITDYIIAKQSMAQVDVYNTELSNLVVRLSSKLGGFTTQDKFKLILDSRSPLNTGNVFIPEENYRIVLNTSSPITTINYSGVIVEKQASGYTISGYSKYNPSFKYFKPVTTGSDPVLNVGGISETFSNWAERQYYVKNKIVLYNGAYYRTQTAHTSSTIFEIKYFVKMPKLPLTGGRDLIIRTRFEEQVSTLHYGAELRTVQDVVDFLVGHGEYLKSIGVSFEHFNDTIKTVTDFNTSAKEFAFWTTQNWSAGAIISLSPCAEELLFQRDYCVVDNIQDNFYEYSVFKQDGNALSSSFTNSARSGNSFSLSPQSTADGIYHANLNLVQKEHVLILDNITIFNDTIYDQIQGYRQDRIKVVGYRTSDWQGDFDIPGFIYDRATVQAWTPWKDFNLGDTVKYKEFYYSANTNVPGSEVINFDQWNKLTARPQPKLIPNWDYRANQFADFYDLDTNSFDVDQQKFAQHLIGYQKRQYLENIINDDVSQYKFYQGFITEKGTANSFSKLFDALSTSTKESFEFYEEWAVRVGQYGATMGFEEVEFQLDERKLLINPQPIELVNFIDPTANDFVYRILPDEVYLTTKTYNHAPFPTKDLKQNYVSTAGYVRNEDVEILLNKLEDCLSVDINQLNEGYYFWVGYDRNLSKGWNVYRFTLFANAVNAITTIAPASVLRIFLNSVVDADIKVDDFVGINNTVPSLEGFHQILTVGSDYIDIKLPEGPALDIIAGTALNLYKFIPVRMSTITDLNTLQINQKKQGDIVWIDGKDNNWSVWKYDENFDIATVDSTKPYFGKSIAVNDTNTMLLTAMQNTVAYYARPTDKTPWVYRDELTAVSTQAVISPNPNLLITNGSFGSSIAVSADSKYLMVGVPLATSPLGNLNTSSNQGYAALYVKNTNNFYVFSNLITAGTISNNQFFGHSVSVVNNKVIVAAKGSSTTASSVSVYSLSTLLANAMNPAKTSNDALITTITFAANKEISSIAVSGTETVVIAFADHTVKLYNVSDTTPYLIQSDITVSSVLTDSKIDLGTDSNFASSIAISRDGKKIAIGAPEYKANSKRRGAVVVYHNTPSAFNNWSVTVSNFANASTILTSSTNDLTIDLGIKELVVRRGGAGLTLGISVVNGLVQLNPTIVSGGSGYRVNDRVIIVSGNENAVYKVTTVNNGSVTAGALVFQGTNYYRSFTATTRPEGFVISEAEEINLTYNSINYMSGVVTSYDDTTGRLVVNIKEAFTPGVYVNTTSAPTELLVHPFEQSDEEFGSVIKFNTAGDQLAITALGGHQESTTTFDSQSTTFDLDATTFTERERGVGSVLVYDVYGTSFIYSTQVNIGDALGTNFGTGIAATNRIYVGDYTTTAGNIYEFKSTKKAWSKVREPAKFVDIDKIKSVFLYDIEDNSVITYLDIVDPLQGKILGVAEQELKFKTYYDPATYSYATDENVVLDQLMSWKEKQVGQLWWDLSSAKFVNPNQGTALYKANTWNLIFAEDVVDVFEWVESEYTPAEWDLLADTEEGLTLGISGTSKYGNTAYSTRQTYDNVSKTFKNVYYFWVKNKKVVPDVEGRIVSAYDVANYISSPKNMGVSYIALHDKNQFSLVNCKSLITGRKVALNIRYWVIDNFKESNIHNHYQLMSASDIDRPINKYIEQKWFDSLSGFDSLGNEVPDTKLPVKLKYGIQSRPRQSMFVNRVEALKQFIERVNSVLLKKSIIDDFDFTDLNSKDTPPAVGQGRYDYEVATYSAIRFVGINEVSAAVLTPVIETGKIIRVNIVSSGQGYVNPPNVVISGIGTGAVITTVLGDRGQVISAVVEKTGDGYLASTTSLTVRPLSVLVSADETANNKWTLYSWNATNKTWFREQTQTFDTTRYWKYVDWYLDGYSQFTKVDQILDFAYQLPFSNVQLGDVVKVKNQGIGGWVLLEKIDTQDVIETTVNYKTVGREAGTIQFTDNLYKFAANSAGFDGPTFDSFVYDDQPKEEIKIILNTIKNNIFVDDLAVDYKELFFASLRYAYSEQKFVDWAFKTSFVRSKHNLGNLTQKPTYQNDNLDSYRQYIDEAKPYRSKIREFVSTYDAVEYTNSQVSDFDLPPRYSQIDNSVKTFSTKISDNVLIYDSPDVQKYPYSDWLYNVGFNLTSIEVVDGGVGYTTAPIVTIVGAPSNITAKAYLSSGTVTKIIITDPFNQTFLTTPTILLEGSVRDGGRPGRAIAVLSNSLVRSTKIGIKFDRVAPASTFSTLDVSQTFVGTGSKTRFELTWPIDIIKSRTTVSDANGEVLATDYTVFNELDTTYTYKRYKGVLQFEVAPSNLTTIEVNYRKSIELLDAADRINYYYNPQAGQLGKDLGQLMQGVDYGGVEITGIGFDVGSGWDALPWFTTGYDQFDPDFTDMVIKSNGNSRTFNLTYAPTEIEYITVYWTGTRSKTVATPIGTGTQGSSILKVSSAANIALGQSVTGTGVPEDTVVSFIVGTNITLSNNLEQPASGTYTFVTTEEFNRRLDDQNFADVRPLEITVASLEINIAALVQQLAVQQELKDTNNLLLTQTSVKLNELGAELDTLTPGSPEYIAVDEQIVALNLTYQTAESARDNAVIQLAEINDQIDTANATLATTQAALAALPAIVNNEAVMNSFIGDGTSVGPITIPSQGVLTGAYGTDIVAGDTIILRKNTSDGSFKPSDIAYDTQIFGGDFAYASATGVAPEDINIDGDGFVTPNTSHAPEEVVTGQVVDTVDITVYHKISDGAPVIETVKYTADADITSYAIGQQPVTSSAVIVKASDLLLTETEDYVVNYQAGTIELVQPLATGTNLIITSLSQNGLNILDIDYFVADGTTTEYVSAARWSSEVTVFVTVDGIATEIETFVTTAEYELVGNIAIRFVDAPETGAIISYTILGSAVDSISKVQREVIAHTGARSDYVLSNTPVFFKPIADNVLVIHNGQILRPTDTEYFDVSGTNRTYTVNPSKYGLNTIDTKLITVTVNGVNITQSIDYSWTPVNNQLKIKKGVAKTGDKVAISIRLNADYFITETPLGTVLNLVNSYQLGDTFTVVSFSNHDILNIERQHSSIKSESLLSEGVPELYSFNQLTDRRIKLRRPAIGSNYVWIAVNSKLLTPDVDYTLESNMKYVKLSPGLTINDGSEGGTADIIDVIAFGSTVTRQPFAYKIFKDMLNRNTYTRIDDGVSTTLASPLNYYDSSITLEDASNLPEPNARLNKAGVVFVAGERIEYLRKEGNVLRQIKRGTLGTGVKSTYLVGTLVRDQSTTQSIPYSDQTITETAVTDGYSSASQVYPNSATLTVSSVTFNQLDQTASAIGGDLVTLTGTGFKINVKVFVGNTECTSVTRLSDSSLTFITPAKPIGAYDLVVYNPPISAEAGTDTTLLAATVALETDPKIATVTFSSPSTAGLKVGMMVNKVSGIAGFGNDAIISEIVSSTVLKVTATTANIAGAVVLNAVNQTPTSRVVPLAISYQKLALNFAPIKSTHANFYRTSIPASYNQCNDIEVFVAGRRLRKAEFTEWSPLLGPDSPIGDVRYEAEFSVDGSNHVRLTKAPEPGVSVVVQKRIGKTWTTAGVSLTDSTMDAAKFIKAATALIPDKNKV